MKSILGLFSKIAKGNQGEALVLESITRLLKNTSNNEDNFFIIPKVQIEDGTISKEIDMVLLHRVYGLFIMFPISEDSIEKAGQFGDSFGVINTLFSGSAFIALVITIYLQQQEMRETKKETQRQNFENTFFKMIDLYKSVVKDLSLEIPRIYNGIFSDDGIEEFSYTQYKIGEVLLFRGEKDLQGKEVIDELLKIFNMYKYL